MQTCLVNTLGGPTAVNRRHMKGLRKRDNQWKEMNNGAFLIIAWLMESFDSLQNVISKSFHDYAYLDTFEIFEMKMFLLKKMIKFSCDSVRYFDNYSLLKHIPVSFRHIKKSPTKKGESLSTLPRAPESRRRSNAKKLNDEKKSINS